MKKSNLILGSVIGTISLIIVIGAFDMRLNGSEQGDYEQVYAAKPLLPFKYLVVGESTNVNLTSADEPEITILHGRGEQKPQVSYHQAGDTLFVDYARPGPEARTLEVNVQAPAGNLEWIKAENSSFTLSDFHTSGLAIHSDKSRVTITGKELLDMGLLEIKGLNESEINVYNVRIDTLDLYLDASKATLSVKIDKLKGYLINGSSLSAKDAADLQVRKDSTSRME